MAVSTAITTLKYKGKSGTPADFEKLVDIVNYPDLGSTPSKLDTTTLSAKKFKTSILGLQEVPDLTFECNYDKADYDKIAALTGKYTFKLEFGEDGADGAFQWDGTVQIYVSGSGVDEVRKMTLVLSCESEITEAV